MMLHRPLLRSTRIVWIIVAGAALSACSKNHSRAPGEEAIFHVALGYKDARPARLVADPLERLTLIRALVADCPRSDNSSKLEPSPCGFARDPEDGDRFTRDLRGPSGRLIRFTFIVTQSAAGLDDDENRENPFQRKRSEDSERNFLEGVAREEPTLYIGHSRSGGGPDFGPPRLTSGGHVNYGWYRQRQPGLQRLLSELERAPSRSSRGGRTRLALLSCASKGLFSRPILAKIDQADLVTVGELLYHEDSIRLTLQTLKRWMAERLARATDPAQSSARTT